MKLPRLACLCPSPGLTCPPLFPPSNMSNALANAVCQRCQARFAPAERIVNSNGELYHEHCFVCAQCFRPFPEGLFYEVSTWPGPSAGLPYWSLSPHQLRACFLGANGLCQPWSQPVADEQSGQVCPLWACLHL